MRTNLFLIVFFALSWLLLMTTCEKMEVELNRDKDEVDTTEVDTTNNIDTINVDTIKTQLIVDGPPKDSMVLVENFVTFRWHIKNAKDSITYISTITYIFAGGNYITVNLGENTEYTLYVAYPQTGLLLYQYDLAGYWPLNWKLNVKSSNGEIYDSGFRTLRIVKTQVVLDSLKTEIQDTTPGKFDYTRHINVTFYWHIKNLKEGEEISNYTIFLEWTKVYHDYWSSVYEAYKYEEYIVGNKTEYTLELSRYWNWNASIKWAVKAETSDGRLYESDTLRVNILPESNNIKVILDGPPNDAKLIQGYVTFSCHLENSEPGVTYTYGIFFDKGPNPFDTWFERWADLGEATEYTTYMSARWWSGFCWGVAVEGSDGSVGHSETRSVRIIKE